MNASDMIFTTIEMEIMYRSNQDAYADYKSKLETGTDKERNAMIVVEEFKSLEEYTRRALKSFATVCFGDVVLMEGDKEIKRYKSRCK